MKIAIVVPGGVDRSGTDKVIPCQLWLIERLAAGDDEVHVFALYQEPRPGRWRLLGAKVHNAGARPQRLRALAQMLKEQRRGRFDVVHAFWAAGPGVTAALFGSLTGVPTIVTLPGGDLAAIPDIHYGARLSWRGRLTTHFALSRARRVTAPSHWMAARAAAIGVEARRLPYGVALDRWPVRSPRARDPRQPIRLVHVASLNPVKDQATLLHAARALRDRGVDYRLEMIGDDTLDGRVQRLCSTYDLDQHVVFLGFLSHAELRLRIEQADMLVISSRHEGVPIAALEAAIAGVPPVGTAVGQIADWAPDAALAVPVGDGDALAAAIETLAADEPERLRLARNAQARAIAEDADRTARMTRDLYVEVQARKSGPRAS